VSGETLTMHDKVEIWFTYHSPTEAQRIAYEAIRPAARHLAHIIIDCTPPSADQTAALRLLREVVMTANAAIACEGV
jgi:hypothetical protein